MIDPGTTASDLSENPTTAILSLPTVAHARGYSKIDAIGSPEVNILRSVSEAERCGIDHGPDPTPSTDKADRILKQSNKKLSLFVYRILYLTELPFLVMWTYATYWTYLVVMYANQVRTMIWLSALVASILVGVGLNANAYEMLSERETIDYGVVARFFVIPFGVSSLSGMTNQLREQFLLVFPRDPIELCVAILLPAFVVSTLFVTRLLVLTRLPIKRTWSIVFLNTKEIKSLKPGPSLITRLIRFCLRCGKRSSETTPMTSAGDTTSEGSEDCFNKGTATVTSTIPVVPEGLRSPKQTV